MPAELEKIDESYELEEILMGEKPVYPIYYQIHIRDYLIWSVINFILFGWGAWQASSLAFVFSLLTQDSVKEENIDKAKFYSKMAFGFNMISLVKGLIVYPIMFIYWMWKKLSSF